MWVRSRLRLHRSRDDGHCSAFFRPSIVSTHGLGRKPVPRCALGCCGRRGASSGCAGGDVRNGNRGRLCDQVQPSASRRRSDCLPHGTGHLRPSTRPPPGMPIIAVRRRSSVTPIIIGTVCAVVVADPFREYVRTPLGFDHHTPSPTRTVYSGLYRRSIMAPRSEPAVLMPVHMAAC
jgi:hypothetical protein